MFLLGAVLAACASEPTLQNLDVLAVIVALRTFLSFALELEVSGRRPWQRADERDRHAEP